MTPIRMLGHGWNVQPLLEQLAGNPGAWNTHPERTQAYGTPHKAVSDIWVRYGETPDACKAEHESVWYPVVNQIPAAWSLARRVFHRVGGKRLGGVLITKVPAGGEVKRHVDYGWHAGYYEKFAVQAAGNKEQAFCFDDAELRPVTGDLYTFRNDVSHWVMNPSAEDRITLIICIKR